MMPLMSHLIIYILQRHVNSKENSQSLPKQQAVGVKILEKQTKSQCKEDCFSG